MVCTEKAVISARRAAETIGQHTEQRAGKQRLKKPTQDQNDPCHLLTEAVLADHGGDDKGGIADKGKAKDGHRQRAQWTMSLNGTERFAEPSWWGSLPCGWGCHGPGRIEP